MQPNDTPIDVSIVFKPSDVSDRTWQMFEGRYIRGIGLKQLAKDFGVTASAVSGACTLVHSKLVRRWSVTSDKSTISQLAHLARPLTKDMWESIYFSAPEMFPGIQTTARRPYSSDRHQVPPDDPGYFEAGQYDARHFADAFTPELGTGIRPKWADDPVPVDKAAIRLQMGVEKIAGLVLRESEKVGVSSTDLIDLTRKHLDDEHRLA